MNVANCLNGGTRRQERMENHRKKNINSGVYLENKVWEKKTAAIGALLPLFDTTNQTEKKIVSSAIFLAHLKNGTVSSAKNEKYWKIISSYL